MLNDKTIAVIRGGKSAERKISLKTGKAILNALKSKNYTVVDIDPKEDLHQQLADNKIDIAFIALHGRYGEDGTIQGFLEMEGIPYTGSGVLGSALAMDKVSSKRVFEQMEISTPEFIVLKKEEYCNNKADIKTKIEEEFSLPVVVKPALEGSSLGLSITKDPSDLLGDIDQAFDYDEEVLIENYIPGREITVGILGNKELEALPVIEIRPREGVYDYEAKYTKGATKFIIPAELDETVYAKAQNLALQAHRALNCQGVSRVDMRVNPNGEVYVLEVNTIPGMTETSLLPQAAAKSGLEFPELVEKILKLAIE
ncbi:D-alanine--D-alanine ligase family protein [Halanaerobacter jeridensis]|uniref:D-alanine--D-alanine ligase n=1 Tax=Halanaerobacter jeridensis TaxID=706427 RepID=A0A939BQ66_9FIRM|nr:D-alanine--D-alanine ligase [Halanaerobacter jeridensis]MBM7557932.1 D-alanine-D-alanine ligase [Halanaerobacter jeridensis]